ncbi:hypothetical protein [Chryseobacterium sp.]|uniref:hypothetical protein n=1 Tax=Chryseobacterium sp. TaxID=1871047 RepID=UPI002FCA0E42
MVKHKKYMIFLTFFSFFSQAGCQKIDRVQNKLLKEVENFNVKDFPDIAFDKIYILEGMYIAKGKFGIVPPKLETQRGSDSKHYDDFLVFNSNGRVDKFYAENIKAAKLLISKQPSNTIYGILAKKKEEWVIKTIQAYKMGGYGTYNQHVKAIDHKVYVQSDGYCSVYLPTE